MKAGDKVVCVDDNYTKWAARWLKFYPGWPRMPKKGEVYFVEVMTQEHDGPYVTLLGFDWILQGPCREEGERTRFKAQRFRLVSEVGHPPVAVQVPAQLTAP